jgi:hypothetical protein
MSVRIFFRVPDGTLFFLGGNMFKKIGLILFLIAFFLSNADTVSAENFVVSASASLNTTQRQEKEVFDLRVFKLTMFLKKYDSPLEPYASYIIQKADEYSLDWRLVAAISGVESTFGKNMPRNSYNAYGWANGVYKFRSWEESLEIVSKTLREKYINRGADSVEKIGRIYAPPSKTWAGKVKYFMNKIDSSPVDFAH